MWQKIKNILMIIILSTSAFAMNCKLAKSLNHPTLLNNSEFWDAFGKIDSNDSYALENLIKKYSPEALSEVETKKKTSNTQSSKEVFSINSKAEKAIAKLTQINQRHFDEFIALITEKGTQGLYEQPKRWHYEKLKGSGGEHTVRLDQGYRVLFKINDGVVSILDVGNHITH